MRTFQAAFLGLVHGGDCKTKSIVAKNKICSCPAVGFLLFMGLVFAMWYCLFGNVFVWFCFFTTMRDKVLVWLDFSSDTILTILSNVLNVQKNTRLQRKIVFSSSLTVSICGNQC